MADFGHDVSCVDSDALKIDALSKGHVPIYEPGLDQLVEQNVVAGRLSFTSDLSGPVASADVVFTAVGTPSRRGDGHADLSYVYAAARLIAKALRGFTVVVTKSTVPLGTGDEVERIIREENPRADIAVVSNPEFLRQGSAIADFKRPDRIVIGLSDERARAVMTEIYRPLYLNQAPLLFTTRRGAELIKYAANAFLAMKITFMNELADLCEETGADVEEIAMAIGFDNRIGARFLHAGPGFGGSCLPKDNLALVKTAQDYGRQLRLVETTIAINDQRKRGMARKVVAACNGSVRGKTIALLGLTFKPNTDDMRDAPSLTIIQALQDQGAQIKAFDPAGMEAAKLLLDKVSFAEGPYDAAEGADALVIITEWDAFRALDFDRLSRTMRSRILIDLRNIYQPADVARAGFSYTGIGRVPIDGREPPAGAAETNLLSEALP
jgi:UDPglucose 6-dehydrogenase